MTKSKRGGPRKAGPGKKMGAPRKEQARTNHKSVKVSSEVAEYLTETGTGIIEGILRKTKAFRDWKNNR